MVKKHYIFAMVSFLSIPVITVLAGVVFDSINPEIAAVLRKAITAARSAGVNVNCGAILAARSERKQPFVHRAAAGSSFGPSTGVFSGEWHA